VNTPGQIAPTYINPMGGPRPSGGLNGGGYGGGLNGR
jgi:hypothetical protein